MSTIIKTKWDENDSISTSNINTWDLFNTLIVENNIVEISINSAINLSLQAEDNNYIYRNSIVAGKYSITGNLTNITDINIKSPLYYKPIGITTEEIPANSFGSVAVIGKIINLRGSTFYNIISDEYNYSPLFVTDTGVFTNIEGVEDILLDDTNYLVMAGLKLDNNEIYFYPEETPTLVSNFNTPQIFTTNYYVGENINVGDIMHLDIDTNTVYIASMDLNRYNIIGICTKSITQNLISKQPVQYIIKGAIEAIDNTLTVNPVFPSFSTDDLNVAMHPFTPIYLGESTDAYQLSANSNQSYGILIVGWLNNNSGIFYLNPYPVNITTTLLPKKHITLSIPSRNINYMADDDNLLIYELTLNAEETMVFLESQLNYIELNGTPVLDNRIYGKIEGWNIVPQYNWLITYHQLGSPEFPKDNEYWWNTNTNVIKRFVGGVWVNTMPTFGLIIFDNTTNKYYKYTTSWIEISESEVPTAYTLQTLNLPLSQYQEYIKNNNITGPAKIYVRMYNKYGADVITNGYINLLLLKE